VEEQFYLLLPLIFLLFNYFKADKKAVYLLVSLFVACYVVRFLNWQYLVAPYLNTDEFGARFNEFVYYPTYNRLDGLLVGVSMAGLFTFYPGFKEWVNKYNYPVLSAGLLIVFAAWFLCPQQSTYHTVILGFPMVAIGYGLILAAFVSPDNIFYRLQSKVTSLIATLSYSIYLSHKIIIHLVQNLLEKQGLDRNSNVAMVICIACIIAGALAIRYLIEKPALSIRNKVLAKWR
jgi:peptidoglycan/LPS O-acetylase OafA/YrhL